MIPVGTVPAVEARGVSRTLARAVPVHLVRDIDFVAAPGELVAITGPSGSGKSSLLYLLGLLDRPDRGTILIGGCDTTGLDDNELARLRLEKIGFVFQFHFLLPEFTVLGNALIPMHRLARLAEPRRERRARDVLDQLGLGPRADRLPDQLSGGERQRAAIARALANDPPLLLADEPTGNLDTANARAVFDIFARVAHDNGRTVVVVTHDLDLAALCDRRVHLVDGQVVAAEPVPPIPIRRAG
jgi:lipoprotein-releasing system ATP-binding protein